MKRKNKLRERKKERVNTSFVCGGINNVVESVITL